MGFKAARVAAGFGVLVLGPACGDSSGGTASDSNSASGTSTGGATDSTSSATEPTSSGSMSGTTTGNEGGMSESLSGTTGAEGGMSDSLSGTVSSGVESDSQSGTGTTATTGMMSGGGESTGGETSSGGEPVDCASFDDEVMCKAAGCMAILGRLFVTDDAALCLDSPSFLACAEVAACAGVITTVCKGQVKYQLPNSCIPDDYVACEPPFDPDMMYEDCQ